MYNQRVLPLIRLVSELCWLKETRHTSLYKTHTITSLNNQTLATGIYN